MSEEKVAIEMAPESDFSPEQKEAMEKRIALGVAEATKGMLEVNQKRFDALLEDARDKLKASMTPPTHEQVQKILEQEYIEFHITLPFNGGTREFTLREMPMAVEKKFYARLKKEIVPISVQLSSLTTDLLQGEAAKKIENAMNMIEPVLDVMAYACSVALDPRGEDTGIDEDWVKSNLSSSRIMAILNAQATCNRMRDFLSILSRGTKALM
jgi:hypothetical protein